MGDDPTEHVQEEIHHHATHGEGGHSGPKWITIAALTAAFLAAFAAVSSSAASSHLTESTLTRIESNDRWGQFNTKSVKKNDISTRQFAVMLADPARLEQDAVKKQIASDAKKLKEYDMPEEEDNPEDPQGTVGLRLLALKLEHESHHELKTHETYETAETMFHIAIAIVAIAVVAKRKEFLYVSMVAGATGVFFFTSAYMHASAAESEHPEPETHSATAPEHPGTVAEKAAPASHEAAPATTEKH